MNGQRQGYERRRITPYIHIMVQHLPRFLELHRSITMFTGQGVVKNNDVARSIVLRKSNKWDSAGDVLRHEQRQWELRECERLPRNYAKTNERYWQSDRENRQKRQRISVEQQMNEASVTNQSNADLPSPGTMPGTSPETSTGISHDTSTGTILGTEDFSRMNVKELRQELKSRNAKGFSRKNKAELIEQLNQMH